MSLLNPFALAASILLLHWMLGKAERVWYLRSITTIDDVRQTRTRELLLWYAGCVIVGTISFVLFYQWWYHPFVQQV